MGCRGQESTLPKGRNIDTRDLLVYPLCVAAMLSGARGKNFRPTLAERMSALLLKMAAQAFLPAALS